MSFMERFYGWRVNKAQKTIDKLDQKRAYLLSELRHAMRRGIPIPGFGVLSIGSSETYDYYHEQLESTEGRRNNLRIKLEYLQQKLNSHQQQTS